MIHSLSLLLLTFAFGGALAAQNAVPPTPLPLVPAAAMASEVPRYLASELAAHPLHPGGLELRIQKFSGPLIGSDGGLIRLSIRIENKSTESRPFALEDLVAVGSDGTQALLALPGHGNYPIFTSVKTQVAPGAHLTLADCQFSVPVLLPARIYYGGQLLLEVTGK